MNKILQSVIDMNRKLSKYAWGTPTCKTNNCFESDNPNDWKDYKVLSPKELDDYKMGTCIDYVVYEYWYLSTLSKPDFFNCYATLIKLKGQSGSWDCGHAFILVGIEGKVYYIEPAWKGETGVYEFNNVQDAIKYVLYKTKDSDEKSGQKWESYKVVQYNPLIDPKPGYSYEKYVESLMDKKPLPNIKPENIKPIKKY